MTSSSRHCKEYHPSQCLTMATSASFQTTVFISVSQRRSRSHDSRHWNAASRRRYRHHILGWDCLPEGIYRR